MQKKLVIIMMGLFMTHGAMSEVVNNTYGVPPIPTTAQPINTEETVPNSEGMSELEVIKTLRNDIATLDAEIEKCNRKRKGWVATTVVGGVGVLGTGIAALVQNKKLKEKKAEINTLNTEIQNTNAEIQQKQNQLNNLNTSQQ